MLERLKNIHQQPKFTTSMKQYKKEDIIEITCQKKTSAIDNQKPGYYFNKKNLQTENESQLFDI